MSYLDNAISRISQTIDKRVSEVKPFRAIVTGVSGNLTYIQRLTTTTPDAEPYGKVTTDQLTIGDDVLCLIHNGKPVILGIVNRTIAGGGGSGAVDSVNGATGVVVLDADDIAATATRLWLTTAERTKLTNTSGTNTGDQVLPDQLTDLDTTVTGAQLNALKTKVDGVADGATANATDAQLRDRTTHTGTQSADTITDGTTNKAYTATEKTKLAGIATGATANATDAQLRDRATHTGEQAISTVTGLQAALDAKADDTDLASYLTTAAAPELIRDTMGTALVAGANVTITPNDAGDTITIAAAGGGGATNLTATLAPSQITVNSDTGTDAVLPAADGTNAGLMLPAEKTKLAGIAAGAGCRPRRGAAPGQAVRGRE